MKGELSWLAKTSPIGRKSSSRIFADASPWFFSRARCLIRSPSRENVAFPLVGRDDYEDEEKIAQRVQELLDMLEVTRIFGPLALRPEHRDKAGRRDCPGACRRSRRDPLRRAHHHGRSADGRAHQRLDPQAEGKFHKTSIVVTHDTHLAKKLADRVIFLQEGRVAFFGTWPELEKSQDPFLRNFLLQDELIPALDADRVTQPPSRPIPRRSSRA